MQTEQHQQQSSNMFYDIRADHIQFPVTTTTALLFSSSLAFWIQLASWLDAIFVETTNGCTSTDKQNLFFSWIKRMTCIFSNGKKSFFFVSNHIQTFSITDELPSGLVSFRVLVYEFLPKRLTEYFDFFSSLGINGKNLGFWSWFVCYFNFILSPD